MKKFLKKISDPKVVGAFSKSGLGLAAILVMVGCDNTSQNTINGGGFDQSKKNGVTTTIKQQENGRYKTLEENPTRTTSPILNKANGKERKLNQEGIDKIVAKESKKTEKRNSQ